MLWFTASSSLLIVVIVVVERTSLPRRRSRSCSTSARAGSPRAPSRSTPRVTRATCAPTRDAWSTRATGVPPLSGINNTCYLCKHKQHPHPTERLILRRTDTPSGGGKNLLTAPCWRPRAPSAGLSPPVADPRSRCGAARSIWQEQRAGRGAAESRGEGAPRAAQQPRRDREPGQPEENARMSGSRGAAAGRGGRAATGGVRCVVGWVARSDG